MLRVLISGVQMVMLKKEIKIDFQGVTLHGILTVPEGASGLILFAHGSGSGRHSPRNQFVADNLVNHHLGTLLFDLLTMEEEKEDSITAEYRFDIVLLADRLKGVTDWVKRDPELGTKKIGYFGASTGAAAALVAAVLEKGKVSAIVSRGGRPDLALDVLPEVKAPVLLIVGGNDRDVIPLNEVAFDELTSVKKLEIVPGATHLFEEPGALKTVADLAAAWFLKYCS